MDARMFSLILFLTSTGDTVFCQNISASGGGIVKPGDDLVLTYNYGQVWDRCYWSWKNATNYCSFDLDTTTGVATKHKCNPSNFGASMSYTGKKDTECQVTISRIKVELNGTWFARVDSETDRSTEVVVAVPVTSGEITVGNDTMAGVESQFACKMHGGRPEPSIIFKIESVNDSRMLNISTTIQQDSMGNFDVVKRFSVNLTVSEHNKTVSCAAIQRDKNQSLLFNEFEASTVILNVTFPPQPMASQQAALKGKMGASVNVTFEVASNPRPNLVRWVVTGQKENATVVSMGNNTGKYKAYSMVETGAVIYSFTLSINNLTAEDERNSYMMEVENALGKQSYGFNLSVFEELTTTTTTTPSTTTTRKITTSLPHTTTGVTTSAIPEKTRSNFGLAFGILAAIVIVVVAAVTFYFYRKKRASRNATVPFSMTEVR